MTKANIIELNSKSRKGLYVYVKGKGKKGSYYKYKEEVPIDNYIKYYEKTKEKGAKHKEEYKKLIKKPKIDTIIKKGITHANIRNTLKATNKEINRAKESLLGNLVKNKKLTKVLTQHQNMQKIKNRLEYRIKIKDEEGKVRITATKFNDIPEKVVAELKETYKEGNQIEYGEKKLKQLGYKSINGKKEKFKVGSVSVQIIFRKAK